MKNRHHSPSDPVTHVDPPKGSFPIVGIGASAGGLAAFEAFFSTMPPALNTGMAFVLVQHLAPDHKSILASIVERYTRMRVYEVEDGMPVNTDCTYIIPPNRDMAVLHGTLQLLEPAAPRGQRLPIDFFFRSLAQDRHEEAICIILSGTGSDGSLGLRAVKGEGGMVMAQTPETTEYDGMPRSAIATGLVDYVLPPAEMPARLMAYVSHAYRDTPSAGAPPALLSEEPLQKVMVLLRAHTGHDFSLYKQSTIGRRVERRMAVNQIKSLEDYVRYLQQAPAEAEALFRDLLIGVTSFFRDPKVFAVVEEKVVTRLVAEAPLDSWIRAWVPGCSTGEEAYSLAMLFQEQRDAQKKNCRVQIFATDIDRLAIEQARAGIFAASIAPDISPTRLARFFATETDGMLRVQQGIRDMLVFSEQDLIKDPPFSRLDLISCRNLLIYMGPELQKRLMPLFYYSLNPGGMLLLGTSETIGDSVDLFDIVDRTARLYRKNRNAQAQPLAGPIRRAPHYVSPATFQAPRKPPLRELTEETLLRLYSPAAALVDERGDILYLHGHAGDFLELAPGEPAMNIVKMARMGLRSALAPALREAVQANVTTRRQNVRLGAGGSGAVVSLVVEPVTSARDQADRGRLFLVTIEETAAPSPAALPRTQDAPDGSAQSAEGADGGRIAALEAELLAKEEILHSANEQLQTSNEELRSSNEEMQSMNEELQSTNEELETSKEELQSVNEELTTVNVELQTKVTDLSHVNNDMVNFLAGTGIGTVFVDHQLRIVRFTPTVTQVINLIPTDVGRPVGHIMSNLAGYDQLVADVQRVLATLESKEIEVQSVTGAWYLLRIRPYRTLENVIEGAVVTFTDISELTKARAAIRESEGLRRLAVVVRDANDPITVQTLAGQILAWNSAAAREYGWSEQEALSMNIRDMIPPDLREETLRAIGRLGRSETLEPYRTRRLAKDGRVVDITMTATALVDETGGVYAVATTERRVGAAGS